jgi:superfamily II DNA or RNA helicase
MSALSAVFDLPRGGTTFAPAVPQRVRMRVDAAVTVQGPVAIERDIIEHNTFPNPEFARKERLGLWTGNTDPSIRLYRQFAGSLEVPRGTLSLIIRCCRDRGVPFEIQNDTVAPALDIPVTSGVLYPYQARGLDQLLAHETGCLEAPTGSGKTNILLSAIPRLGTRTLILVHSRELFTQTRARCREWLGYDPGALGAGQWSVKPISVGMIQTLAKRDLTELRPYFGCVLVDEAHHAPARTWAGILDELPTRYKYGVTATAFRKDGLECVMWRTIGTVTARVDPADARRAGTVVTPQIETVDTNFEYDLQDSTEWTSMISALVRDDNRNALIVSEIRKRLSQHRRALVLSDRIEHVYLLADRLKDLRPVILTGDLSKAERDAAMGAVRGGARLTIATTALLGEGVDVPGWDVLFLATPMAGGPRTLQAVGRVTRAAPGKVGATVVDFLDSQVPALAVSHQMRKRMYARR